METNKLSEKEFGELFSAAYDEIREESASPENDMSEFLETLAFSLVLTIDEKTGMKVSNRDILQQLMICSFDDEVIQDKEKLSAALLQRLKCLSILQFSPDSAK